MRNMRATSNDRDHTKRQPITNMTHNMGKPIRTIQINKANLERSRNHTKLQSRRNENKTLKDTWLQISLHKNALVWIFWSIPIAEL